MCRRCFGSVWFSQASAWPAFALSLFWWENVPGSMLPLTVEEESTSHVHIFNVESMRMWTEREVVQITEGPGSTLGCGVVLSVVCSRLQWPKSLKLSHWLHSHRLLSLDEQKKMKCFFLPNKLVCLGVFSDANFSLCVIANGCLGVLRRFIYFWRCIDAHASK